MELNDLIFFKKVASEGSISKAAKELGYVQPNLTERIKRLEEELETPLLHRTNKGVMLLPSGEILLGYTNKFLNLLEEARTTQTILLSYLQTRIKENVTEFQLYMENISQLLPLLQLQKVDRIITYINHQEIKGKQPSIYQKKSFLCIMIRDVLIEIELLNFWRNKNYQRTFFSK